MTQKVSGSRNASKVWTSSQRCKTKLIASSLKTISFSPKLKAIALTLVTTIVLAKALSLTFKSWSYTRIENCYIRNIVMSCLVTSYSLRENCSPANLANFLASYRCTSCNAATRCTSSSNLSKISSYYLEWWQANPYLMGGKWTFLCWS